MMCKVDTLARASNTAPTPVMASSEARQRQPQRRRLEAVHIHLITCMRPEVTLRHQANLKLLDWQPPHVTDAEM
jgi:hypothetical protein